MLVTPRTPDRPGRRPSGVREEFVYRCIDAKHMPAYRIGKVEKWTSGA